MVGSSSPRRGGGSAVARRGEAEGAFPSPRPVPLPELVLAVGVAGRCTRLPQPAHINNDFSHIKILQPIPACGQARHGSEPATIPRNSGDAVWMHKPSGGMRGRARRQGRRGGVGGGAPGGRGGGEGLRQARQGPLGMEQHRPAPLVLVQEGAVLEVCHHRVLALDARVRDAAHLHPPPPPPQVPA